jgi:hypothetical protein
MNNFLRAARKYRRDERVQGGCEGWGAIRRERGLVLDELAFASDRDPSESPRFPGIIATRDPK